MLRKHDVMKHFSMNNEIKIRVTMVIRNGPTAEVKRISVYLDVKSFL